MATFARHRLRTSVLLRGTDGFGARRLPRTDASLTLSEDLPVVALAVDEPGPIRAALAEVRALSFGGLVTVERARLLEDLATPASDDLEAVAVPDAVKLTLHLGRRARGDGGPAHVVAVAALHRHGVAGATALLGVDGTARGRRERARLVGRNARVPLLVLSVADAGTLRPALAELARLLPAPVATLERVRVLRRAGAAVAPPRAEPPPGTPSGARVKVTVIASEQALVHRRLVDALRRSGAAGATALRGTWGFHGDHPPHGDALLALRRRVPVATVVVDDPARAARWWPLVEEATASTGLVTQEWVPWADAR